MNKQTTTMSDAAARVAAHRARWARNATRADIAAADAELLRVASRRFSEDAVQEACATALSFNKRMVEEGKGEKQVDVARWAHKNARGVRSHEMRARTRRAGREMKYADRWVPSDPTGDAATGGRFTLLTVADGFVAATRGQRGATVDYVALADYVGADVAAVKRALVAAVHVARPGDVVKRARAANVSAEFLATAATGYVGTVTR